MIKKLSIFVGVLLISGCANNSGAYQVGDNQYQVATRATWEFGGRAGAKRMALEEAKNKCSSLGKTVKVISSVENYGHFEGGTVELTFSCE
jgi:hypothetical protein